MKNLLSATDHTALRSVVDEIEASSERLVVAQIDALAAIPSYRRVPAPSLRASCARNVVRVAETLRGSDTLPASVEVDEHASGRERALQGVPAEDVVGAYRLVMGVLRDSFVDAALRERVPVDVVLRGTRQLWEITDALSNELVAARRHIDAELTRREEQQRITFLQRVLRDGLSGSEVATAGSVFGLVPAREYWVVRCRVHADDAHRLLRLLERSDSSAGFRSMLGPLDGDIAGIVASRPVPSTEANDAVIAVVGPVALGSLHAAFREASRLLDIAIRFGRRGHVQQSDLSIRIAVAQESELGEALLDRYVRPVLGRGNDASATLETIRSFLRHDRHVGRCAAALAVHQNTLRYRIQKFEEATGADLRTTESLLEVWWALEYWVLCRGEQTRAVERP